MSHHLNGEDLVRLNRNAFYYGDSSIVQYVYDHLDGGSIETSGMGEDVASSLTEFVQSFIKEKFGEDTKAIELEWDIDCGLAQGVWRQLKAAAGLEWSLTQTDSYHMRKSDRYGR